MNDISVEEREGQVDGSAKGGEMEVDTGTIDEGGMDEEWDGIMDVDGEEEDDLPDFFKEERDKQMDKAGGGASNQRKKKGKIAELVREKVRKVLEDDTKMADRRARSLDQNDYLQLLLAFNKEGIHFRS